MNCIAIDKYLGREWILYDWNPSDRSFSAYTILYSAYSTGEDDHLIKIDRGGNRGGPLSHEYEVINIYEGTPY